MGKVERREESGMVEEGRKKRSKSRRWWQLRGRKDEVELASIWWRADERHS